MNNCICIILVTDRDEDGTPDYNEEASGWWYEADVRVSDYADTDGDGASDYDDRDVDNDNNGINGILLCDIYLSRNIICSFDNLVCSRSALETRNT